MYVIVIMTTYINGHWMRFWSNKKNQMDSTKNGCSRTCISCLQHASPFNRRAVCMTHIFFCAVQGGEGYSFLKTINNVPTMYKNITQKHNGLFYSAVYYFDGQKYFTVECVNKIITWWVCGSTLRFFLWFCLLVLGYTVRASCQLEKQKQYI